MVVPASKVDFACERHDDLKEERQAPPVEEVSGISRYGRKILVIRGVRSRNTAE